LTEVWQKIRRIKGSNHNPAIAAIKDSSGNIQASPNSITEILAESLAANSSDSNYDSCIQKRGSYIAILPAISKVLEKILTNQLNQYGFRKKLSTSSALLDFTEDVA